MGSIGKFRGFVFAVAAAVLIIPGPRCLAAEQGPGNAASNGLRLSASLDQLPPHRDIHILLENVSLTALDVCVGAHAGNGVDYGFQFAATWPDGKQHSLYYFTERPVAGMVVPLVIRLSPGASRTFSFHLKDIGWFESHGKEVGLGRLLQRGDTIRVSLEVPDKSLDVMGGWHSPVPIWTGLVTSGEIRLLNSPQ